MMAFCHAWVMKEQRDTWQMVKNKAGDAQNMWNGMWICGNARFFFANAKMGWGRIIDVPTLLQEVRICVDFSFRYVTCLYMHVNVDNSDNASPWPVGFWMNALGKKKYGEREREKQQECNANEKVVITKYGCMDMAQKIVAKLLRKPRNDSIENSRKWATPWNYGKCLECVAEALPKQDFQPHAIGKMPLCDTWKSLRPKANMLGVYRVLDKLQKQTLATPMLLAMS